MLWLHLVLVDNMTLLPMALHRHLIDVYGLLLKHLHMILLYLLTRKSAWVTGHRVKLLRLLMFLLVEHTGRQIQRRGTIL